MADRRAAEKMVKARILVVGKETDMGLDIGSIRGHRN